MKTKKTLYFTMLILIFSLCSGCVDQRGAANVESKNPRIIATSNATTWICDSLELPLVGMASSCFPLPEKYLENGIPQIGPAMNPDMEMIASLKPTDILGPDSLKEQLLPRYKNINSDYTFLDLNSVQGMYDSMNIIAKKYGKEDLANEAIEEYNKKLELLEKKKNGRKSPTVLLLMGFPGSYVEATSSSYIGNLIEMSGAVNVVSSDDGEDFVNVNTEELMKLNPDYILWTSHAMPDKVEEMFEKEFESNDVWKHFDAVKEGRVIKLDSEIFHMCANKEWYDGLEFLYETFYEVR